MADHNYHSTLPSILLLLLHLHILLLLPLQTHTLNNNITQTLSHYPHLSNFTSLLISSNLLPDLTTRSSLTILAVPNSFFPPSYSLSPTSLTADVIRYHILLQYFTLSDLRRLPPSGTLVTTLLQTTGRAPASSGSLNVTFNPVNGVVSFHPPGNSSISADVISSVATLPYNISIISVDSLLGPFGVDLMAAENRPPPPLGLNITRVLIDGHDFNVAASMLFASGVVDEFEADERGAGITLFVPTDGAFASLDPDVKLQSLTADRKALVLKFHVLHSYYPLGSLESIVNPVQPTLATEDNGAGSFTLNISKVNGSVAINTGVVQAVVTQTVFDQNPVAIFGVSSVLLPKEIFGDEKSKRGEFGKGGGGGGGGPYVGAEPPEIGTVPESSPEGGVFGGPSSHLLSPPVVSSGVWWRRDLRVVLCIGMLYVFVLVL